jgi:hypothetical protein
MKLTQALKLAMVALDKQCKPLAVDANFHDQYGADYPLAVSCSKQRQDLREAIRLLTDHLYELRVPEGVQLEQQSKKENIL